MRPVLKLRLWKRSTIVTLYNNISPCLSLGQNMFGLKWEREVASCYREPLLYKLLVPKSPPITQIKSSRINSTTYSHFPPLKNSSQITLLIAENFITYMKRVGWSLLCMYQHKKQTYVRARSVSFHFQELTFVLVCPVHTYTHKTKWKYKQRKIIVPSSVVIRIICSPRHPIDYAKMVHNRPCQGFKVALQHRRRRRSFFFFSIYLQHYNFFNNG